MKEHHSCPEKTSAGWNFPLYGKGKTMGTFSMTENRTLMAQARESLAGKWELAVVTSIVGMLINFALRYIPVLIVGKFSGDVIGLIISFLIGGVISVGFSMLWLSISRKQPANFSQIFNGFKKFGVALGSTFLVGIFFILWSLLLIVPGIIAGLSYSQTFLILADNDSIGPLEAITKSKEMMRGNKWKFLCLSLRFLGWVLLGILTLGIGFLWIGPYIGVSYAQFYDDIKEQQEAVEA